MTQPAPLAPVPIYIAEQINGTIVDSTLYIDCQMPPGAPITAQGALLIRYALPALAPPGAAIIPGLFLTERGQVLTGREAWDYLQLRFQLHPRADIIGQTPDGNAVQHLVRELDFGAVVRVFAYAAAANADSASVTPLAELETLCASDSAFETLPDLLKRYLLRV